MPLQVPMGKLTKDWRKTIFLFLTHLVLFEQGTELGREETQSILCFSPVLAHIRPIQAAFDGKPSFQRVEYKDS